MTESPYGPSTSDLTDMKRRFIDITHWREMPMRFAPTVSVWLGSL